MTDASSSDSPPSGWRTLAFATSTFAFVAVAVLTFLLAQPRPAFGPVEYDVALPDSAGLTLTTPFVVAPNGTFVVYPTNITPERWELWYRSLLDGTTRKIDGSTGAEYPAISRDSKSLVFVRSRDSVITIEQMPVAGGKAAVLAQAKSLSELLWLDDGHVLSVEADGKRVRTIDVGGGVTSTRPISYCIGASILDGHSLLCAGGGAKYANSNDMQADTLQPLIVRNFTLAGDSVLVHGSHFRVVDEHYVVYESKSGELLAARFDLAKRTIGRPVRMLTGLALRDYSGAGSYAVSANGTLVYATGANHAVGYLVRHGEHSIDTLPIGRDAFLLYAMSPDGKRVAAAVDVLDGQQLRVYDLATGKFDVLANAEDIRQPVWSPTGDRIAYSVPARGGTSAIYIRTLNSTAPVKPVLSIKGFEASAWLPDGRLFGADWNSNLALAVHVDHQPVTVDTLVRDAFFIKPSPDGQWLAYTSSDLTSLWLEPLPGNGRRYSVHTGSGIDDPHWLSSTELIFKNYQGVPGFDRATITKGSENPVSTPRRWLDTPRNLDTPGFSSAITPDGGVMYLQADLEAPVRALRVIPNWVTRMKRAVDDAKR